MLGEAGGSGGGAQGPRSGEDGSGRCGVSSRVPSRAGGDSRGGSRGGSRGDSRGGVLTPLLLAACLGLDLLMVHPAGAHAVHTAPPIAPALTGAAGDAQVRSGSTDSDAPAGAWSWPTGVPVGVVRGFDAPAHPWLPGHRGVDLDVTVGSLVLAPDDGVVVHAGQVVDRGVVSVQHGDHRSTFEPVTPLVSAGQVVARGQPLASVEGGHSPGALHWGVRTGAKSYVNPLRMLVVRVVLKPWEG